ncbi:hypothetical protein NDU88_001675 [Pleurodeles waltl]|uniref:Uncharacterized protein n=1 Tax=Pleurodeles waltl TaxID=8319 RepID=A0AAV7NDA0_PLEWA|nr:hypothetical protein NDU88_001675 [Pleurodeles waltl]
MWLGANYPPRGTATSTRQDPSSGQPPKSKGPVRGHQGSPSPAAATAISQGPCGISHAGPPRQSSLASSPPLLSGALDTGISAVVRSAVSGSGLCRHLGCQVGLVFCWRADTPVKRSTDLQVPCWPGTHRSSQGCGAEQGNEGSLRRMTEGSGALSECDRHRDA